MRKHSRRIYFKPLFKGDQFAFRAVPFDFVERQVWCDLEGNLADGNLKNCSRPPDATEEQQRGIPAELPAAVKKLVEVLPERQRRAVLLYYAEEMTLDDIGILMGGITHQAVSRLLKRASRRIQKAILSDPMLFTLVMC